MNTPFRAILLTTDPRSQGYETPVWHIAQTQNEAELHRGLFSGFWVSCHVAASWQRTVVELV